AVGLVTDVADARAGRPLRARVEAGRQSDRDSVGLENSVGWLSDMLGGHQTVAVRLLRHFGLQ
ncbi:hypothetical protein PFISCL1PPCAC_3161, partial [Pristionchus fissidentatus]